MRSDATRRAQSPAISVELVLSAPQLIAAQVAVACCASRAATRPDSLAELEACRVPLGAEMDALARRLRQVRWGEPSAGATMWTPLRLAARDGVLQPPPAAALDRGAVMALTSRESALLAVAVHRLRGLLLCPPAGIDAQFAAEADAAAEALLEALASVVEAADQVGLPRG